MRDNRDIIQKLDWLANDMEDMEVPGEWLLPVTQARSIIFGLREEIEKLKAKDEVIRRLTLKTERWRGALVHIAQKNGDPAALASAALEDDND